MITINVANDTISGSVNSEVFSVPYNEKVYKEMMELYEKSTKASSVKEMKEIVEKFKTLTIVDLNAQAQSASEHLFYNEKTRTYHLNIGGKAHPVPMPQKLADYLVEAAEKKMPVDPIVKFWMRLLRNPNIRKGNAQDVNRWANAVVEYVTRVFVSPVLFDKYVEQGYSEEAARELAIVRQTPFTMEGLVSTKKVVTPLFDRTRYKFVMEDGQPKKVLRDGIKDTVNEDTGEVTKGTPEYSEDWVFEPYIMGKRGDAFHCGESAPDHIIKVGQEMWLDDWSQVNCNFHQAGVKGIHTGNQDYINGYEREDNVTLNCFIDPAEIGAVAAGDNVLRVKSLFPHSIKDREEDNRNLYHSSEYAKKKDAEWAEIKAELDKEYTAKREEYLKKLEEASALTEGI